MTSSSRLFRILWADALLLAVTAASAAWVATRNEADLEKALGLCSAHGLADETRQMAMMNRLLAAQMGHKFKPLRDRYAEYYPQSPLAKLNRIPDKHAAWDFCSRFQQRALPPFFLLSVGLGWIALRRPRPAGSRGRWGPGRVAAALSVLLPAVSIAEEFVLRRFDFMTHGDYHDTLFDAWQGYAPTVGVAIAAAWTILLLGGQWKLRRGWREWLGLTLGAIWLVNLLWATVLEHLGQN